jgi:hypothetical protein
LISLFLFDSVLVFSYTLAMKTVLSLIFMFLLPFSSIAHPGKTDYRGGHKCWKNCGQWELRRGEYHLHDKDWNPIRLDHKGNAVEAEKPEGVPTPEKRFLLEEPASAAQENSGIPDKHVIVEKHQTLTVYEESVLPLNTIMLLLLAFFMLIILIFVRKRREKG